MADSYRQLSPREILVKRVIIDGYLTLILGHGMRLTTRLNGEQVKTGEGDLPVPPAPKQDNEPHLNPVSYV